MQADKIREYVMAHYIRPARQKGQPTVRVTARDIHDTLGLSDRFPAVCNVLDGAIFAKQAGVTTAEREGPKQSSTTVWLFRLE